MAMNDLYYINVRKGGKVCGGQNLFFTFRLIDMNRVYIKDLQKIKKSMYGVKYYGFVHC